ncbi:hypothetical protein P8452_32763 [Trifolium repens]|nr:hypothetical protein P8452_32763 [Trifolium repens]
MSGARRGPGRPRRNVADDDEPEMYGDANANMWAEMMHQQQQFQPSKPNSIKSSWGDACNWWDGTKAYMEASQMEVTWDNFRRLFVGHYIPESYQFQMERELTELKQGILRY